MQFTAEQIAAMAGGTVEGDGSAIVNTIAKIEEGAPGAISFLSNPKYEHYVYDTASSVVLVRDDFKAERPVKATLIRVPDPYSTVAHLLKIAGQLLEPQRQGREEPSYVAEGVEIPGDAYIGAFAYIGKGVKLGKGVKIFPQTYVGDGVSIGDETVLKPGVKVYHGCMIGSRCIIHAGAVIGADGFGFAPVEGHYEKIPQIGIVEIGDDVEIGANTTVDRATMGATRIGRGTKLDNLLQIAHNCTIGTDTVMAAQSGMAGSSHLGNNCMIGGQVGFGGHITVGDRVNIGAQSGLHTNIASDSTIIGTPAMPVREWMRMVGYQKQLPDIVARLRALEKKVNA